MARTISYTLQSVKITHVVLDFAQERVIVEYFLLDTAGVPHETGRAYFYRNIPPPPPASSLLQDTENYQLPEILVGRLSELKAFIESKLFPLLD